MPRKNIFYLGCGQKPSPGCQPSTAQREEFMWVVPTSGKASWQITADISSCSNRSPLTSCWSRWEEFTPSFPLWQMRTCMYVCVGDCAQGQRQEKDNGVAGCRRSSCSTYMIAVLWGWTTKKGDALFKTPHISAAGTWQFTSRFIHTNCKEETHRQTNKQKNPTTPRISPMNGAGSTSQLAELRNTWW